MAAIAAAAAAGRRPASGRSGVSSGAPRCDGAGGSDTPVGRTAGLRWEGRGSGPKAVERGTIWPMNTVWPSAISCAWISSRTGTR